MATTAQTEQSGDRAKHVFVSHSHQDTAFCERLVRGLRAANMYVWFDEHNLGAGQLPNIIEQELRNSDTFIVVFSPAALTSRWVSSEWYAAWTLLDTGTLRRFIPVIAEPCEIPMLLRGLRWIDFTNQPFERAFEVLMRALTDSQSEQGGEPTTLPRVPKPPVQINAPRLPTHWEASATIRAHLVRGCFAIAWSPAGDLLASGSYDRTICLWKTQAPFEKQATFTGHSYGVDALAWSPDGKTLASGSTGQVARLWDIASGRNISRLVGHTGSVVDVAWAPDGHWLATASEDQTARIWEAATGRCVRVIQGHGGPLTSVAWSPDGQWIGTTSRDATIRIWRVDSGAQVMALAGHSQIVYCVRWSPDGRTIASSGHTTVRLWDGRFGEERAILHGHTGHVLRVAWRRDSALLASSSADRSVIIWDAQAGRQITLLGGHTDWVHGVEWSPDGNRLATCGGKDDGTIRFWSPA